ncbi:MAG: hypothetical protein Q8P67_27345, partial [archaeon]|nr:hypothetical protein [archaeon]
MASSSSEQKVVVYHIHHHFVYYFADAEQQAQQERQVKGGMGRRAMMQTLELVHAGSERATQAGIRLEGTARCRRHLRLKAYRFAVRKHASAEGGYALLRFKNEKKKRQAQTQGDLEEGEVDASFPLLGALVSRSSHGDHCGLDLHTAKPGGGTDHLALVFDSPSECDRWEAAVTRASAACSVDREEVKEKVIHEEGIIKDGGKERMEEERMEKERMEKE